MFTITGLGRPDVSDALNSDCLATNYTNSVRAKVQNFEDGEHYFGKDF